MTDALPAIDTAPGAPDSEVEFDPALASMRPTRTSLPRSVTFAPLPPLPSRPLALMVPPTRSAPDEARSSTGPAWTMVASLPSVFTSPVSATLAPCTITGCPGAFTEAW